MFQLIKSSGSARRGRVQLHRGVVETPVFMPVGTLGTVKTLLPEDLLRMDSKIMLCNTYHMYLRPGLEVLEPFGGLHKFVGWDRPILTDSGGFQVFSLAKQCKLTEEGAHFASHIDGRKFLLTPEEAVRAQEAFGSDIHMVLDECTPCPATWKQAEDSLDRTLRWAQRCRDSKTKDELCQFGIVQGGVYEGLRRKSAKALQEIGFEGYAIGGLSVGESKEDMRAMTDVACQELPTDKPRYLMGVGTPRDLVESVALGVDMFDCVMPSRNARNGSLFTSEGRLNIRNARFRHDQEPLDANCECSTCTTYSRAFLRHLFVAGELTALRLFTVHNITYYLKLMERVRQSIENDTFAELVKEIQAIYPR
ncbi:MAG: tRNA guanosine(34) transglycosylase Tgt [Oligoflexales bacterium]